MGSCCSQNEYQEIPDHLPDKNPHGGSNPVQAYPNEQVSMPKIHQPSSNDGHKRNTITYVASVPKQALEEKTNLVQPAIADLSSSKERTLVAEKENVRDSSEADAVRQREERERVEREKLRLEQEQREETERVRLQKEGDEAIRIQKEKEEQERLQKEKEEERERIENEAKERERVQREHEDRVRLEIEEKERMQRETEEARIQKELADAERIRQATEERERVQKEAEEAERMRKETEEAERIRNENEERERIQKEKAEQERIQKEKEKELEQIKEDQEKLQQDRQEQQKVELERQLSEASLTDAKRALSVRRQLLAEKRAQAELAEKEAKEKIAAIESEQAKANDATTANAADLKSATESSAAVNTNASSSTSDDDGEIDRILQSIESQQLAVIRESEAKHAENVLSQRHETPEQLHTRFEKSILHGRNVAEDYESLESEKEIILHYKIGRHRQSGTRVFLETLTSLQWQQDMAAFYIEWLAANASGVAIIHLLAIYENEGQYTLVREYADRDLFSKIEELAEKEETFPEATVKNLIRQVVLAIQHFHSLGIIHRDLKPESFAYVTLQDGSVSLKLTNFYGAINADTCDVVHGTPGYMAPEMVQTQLYDAKIDVWSIGVLTYVLASGCMPFDGDTDKEIMEAILKAPLEFQESDWVDKSDSMKVFIRDCLQRDPSLRPSVLSLCSHAWLEISRTYEMFTEAEKKEELKKKYKPFRYAVCRANRSHTGSQVAEDKAPAGSAYLQELSFRYGQLITILERPSDEWWWGQLDDGTLGFFNPTHAWEVNRKVARVKGADEKSAVKKIQTLLLKQGGKFSQDFGEKKEENETNES